MDVIYEPLKDYPPQQLRTYFVWLLENGIEFDAPIFKRVEPDVVDWDTGLVIQFYNEEDVMAFRLRWL
jgi:hypothetical protein